MIGGRIDRKNEPVDAGAENLGSDLRAAYERGRRDERAMRKRHPVMMTLTFLAALVGFGLLALAAIHGSFGRAGGVVDDNLAIAADKARPMARQAAANANRDLHDAARSARSGSS